MFIAVDLPINTNSPFHNSWEYVITDETADNRTITNDEFFSRGVNNLFGSNLLFTSPEDYIQFFSKEITETIPVDISHTNNFIEEKSNINSIINSDVIYSAFDKALANYDGNINSMSIEFNRLVHHIADLPFNAINFEILDDDEIKCSISFPEKRMLVINKYLNTEASGIDNDHFVYSYFINRKMIASDVTEMESFFKGFQDYILKQGV